LWDGKQVRPLIQFARATRHPGLPDVPTGRELAKTPSAKALLEFAELPFFMALPFAAPPSIPADRAAALRTAFMATTRDPGFLAEAKRLRLDISPIDHKAIEDLLRRAAATPPDVVARMKDLVGAKSAGTIKKK
jgi:hypothetical protein